MIFVFGSNFAGRHGKGAAKFALENHGAIYGQGIGRQGNSYALPTKDEKLRTLPTDIIERHVSRFVVYAAQNLHETFQLTAIGCGLAGYTPADRTVVCRRRLERKNARRICRMVRATS